MRVENGNAKLYIQHDFDYINISQGQAVCAAYGKDRMSGSKERGSVFSMAVFGLCDYSQLSFHYLHLSASFSCYTGTCIAVTITKMFLHKDSGFERK